MTYQESIEWMFSQLPVFQRIGKAAYKDNLDNTHAIMDLLGQPQNQFKSVHVAGTNGKGSISHLIASAYQEAGFKTGLYTSPHLKDFRERIKINGQMIPEKEVVDFVTKYKNHFETIQPSFFEMTVGMAFDYFAQTKVDIAIIETGMGGRLDSTNVITPELSVITNIGLDHTQFLGESVELIAGEKAGIIKPGIPVLIGEKQNKVEEVFINAAHHQKAPIYFASDLFRIERKDSLYSLFKGQTPVIENIDLPLGGHYQIHNVLTAFSACQLLGLESTQLKSAFENVIKNTSLSGRWQILNEQPRTVCDTGHNEDGLRWVMNQLRSETFHTLHMVVGVVGDKDLSKILPLFPKYAVYYFCQASIPRALDAVALAQEAKSFGLTGNFYPNVPDALAAAQKSAKMNDFIFIGGSTFTVADIL
jgi:dihydrofolate synthase/folylpolyglutamate synthase